MNQALLRLSRGDTHQYYPDLVYDNHQVEPPKTPEEGCHLTADLADKAIRFIADLKQVAPDYYTVPMGQAIASGSLAEATI
jgi:arylsulfatase A-like enzyme